MNFCRRLVAVVFTIIIAGAYCIAQDIVSPIWKNDMFSLYGDRIIQQGKYQGFAISAVELASNYKSPAAASVNPLLRFRFCINGRDVELKPGINHYFTCLSADGHCETPLIRFGEPGVDTRTIPDGIYLKEGTELTIRLDLRKMFDSFARNGYYITARGEKIYREDFKSVSVAGSISPLHWNFVDLVSDSNFMLQDADGDGIYKITLKLNNPAKEEQTASSWILSHELADFPRYKSPYLISDALYNLALSEMKNAIEPDSTFRTGKEWAGVWTRDISYSIILAMAHLQPRIAVNSLLKKVNKKGRIIQDTGTGGAWPCSSDRTVWAIAAWEIFKVTGDRAWLRQAYSVIRNSVEDDYAVLMDPETGLVKGESSFLDWREQSYPKWMQPADIYNSECLGTNAVHYQANRILTQMAMLLGEQSAAKRYRKTADRIKTGINKYLWLPEKGYYAQYLYGRNALISSPRSEALGESLCILFGIADSARQKLIVSRVPVMGFGIPCIYPQIPDVPPYHNNGVWPFVQTYYALAAAQTGNDAAVMESFAAIYRPAVLWLTNKENFVASNGDFTGTQINSSNMLWSLSGSIALIHKIIFGMQFHTDHLSFRPFVPKALSGTRSLTNLKYRNAVLDVEMKGSGNRLKKFMIDGKTSKPDIPADLQGRHQIKMVLTDDEIRNDSMNLVPDYVTIETPEVEYTGSSLVWRPVDGAVHYQVHKSGQQAGNTSQCVFRVSDEGYAEYQVIAIDRNGVQSFASEPLVVAGNDQIVQMEMEHDLLKSLLPYRGFSGDGFVETSKIINPSLSLSITIPEAGIYFLDFRYANGSGRVNTENKCAVRTLKIDGRFAGAIVMPQRGSGEWNNWGFSNAVPVRLAGGKHVVTLSLEIQNENMNGDTNTAMLDYVRLSKKTNSGSIINKQKTK